MTFIAASFPQAFCTALSFRPVSTTAANPAIRCRCGMAFIAASFLSAVAESHSAWPLPQALSSYTLSSFHLLPPSEGAQISLFFVSPSEGAWSRHIFESALCPCFSCRRAFPPSEGAQIPKVCSFKMKRPDVLCRKTSIAITRILVFLPLLKSEVTRNGK